MTIVATEAMSPMLNVKAQHGTARLKSSAATTTNAFQRHGSAITTMIAGMVLMSLLQRFARIKKAHLNLLVRNRGM